MRLRSLMRLQERGGARLPSRGARSPGARDFGLRDSAAGVALISPVRPCGGPSLRFYDIREIPRGLRGFLWVAGLLRPLTGSGDWLAFAIRRSQSSLRSREGSQKAAMGCGQSPPLGLRRCRLTEAHRRTRQLRRFISSVRSKAIGRTLHAAIGNSKGATRHTHVGALRLAAD